MIFTINDKKQIESRGSKLQNIEKQITNFENGFPFLKIEEPAIIDNGILYLSEKNKNDAVLIYESKIKDGLKPLKFVPASGAASRMFKSLFESFSELKSGENIEKVLEEHKKTKKFINHIQEFAFYKDLVNIISESGNELSIENYLEYLLSEKGLNYGKLPKGLLKFHNYEDGERTPFEEHLMEGALYCKDSENISKIHFTVSPEHQKGFEAALQKAINKFKNKHTVSFDVSFSQQKPSTDTIAVDLENNPFRNPDNSLLFRPGGHGALIENLNDLDSDIIFIKNIDNVVPDHLKDVTIEYKKILAGILFKYQENIFKYQKILNERHYSSLESGFLAEAANYLQNTLNTKPFENQYYTEKENLYRYLRQKYNRPIRVCGMVKNLGEPGGGPFWTRNPDYTVSLQIVESSQIDKDSPLQSEIVQRATHFNPVDLVCGIKNYLGEKYNLMDFIDPDTGFISIKSQDGRTLKALELPGLWNGAMSDWITIFVEIPVETFNPVKTVNDLLRKEHQ